MSRAFADALRTPLTSTPMFIHRRILAEPARLASPGRRRRHHLAYFRDTPGDSREAVRFPEVGFGQNAARQFSCVLVCMYDVGAVSGRVILHSAFETNPLTFFRNVVRENDPYVAGGFVQFGSVAIAGVGGSASCGHRRRHAQTAAADPVGGVNATAHFRQASRVLLDSATNSTRAFASSSSA